MAPRAHVLLRAGAGPDAGSRRGTLLGAFSACSRRRAQAYSVSEWSASAPGLEIWDGRRVNGRGRERNRRNVAEQRETFGMHVGRDRGGVARRGGRIYTRLWNHTCMLSTRGKFGPSASDRAFGVLRLVARVSDPVAC